MGTAAVFADQKADYNINEAAVIILAVAFLIALGGVALAAFIMCGWRGAKSTSMDFLRGKATIRCR